MLNPAGAQATRGGSGDRSTPGEPLPSGRSMSIAALTAASAAPEIDRLMLAVHSAGPRQERERLVAAAAVAGLTEPGMLLTNLRPFLEAGPVDREVARLRVRYRPPELLDADIADLVDRGLLDEDGDTLAATERIVPVLDALAGVTSDTVAALWGDRDETVDRLVGPLAAVADAVPSSGFPLFVAHRALPVPIGLLGFNHRIVGVRFARSDAHAAAWAEHGLSAADMLPFTSLWNGDKVSEAGLERLSELEFVDGDTLTPEARALRDRIEADTNDLLAPAFAVLDDPHGFLADLRSLPPLP